MIFRRKGEKPGKNEVEDSLLNLAKDSENKTRKAPIDFRVDLRIMLGDANKGF